MQKKRIVMADGKTIGNVDVFDAAAIHGFVKVVDHDTKTVQFINKNHIVSIEDYIPPDLSIADVVLY